MPFCSGAAGTVAAVWAGIAAPFVTDDFSVWDRTVTSVEFSFCSGAADTVAAVLAGVAAPFFADNFSVVERAVISVDLSCCEFAVFDVVESTSVVGKTGDSVMGLGVFSSSGGFESSSSDGDIVGSGP